MFAQMPLWVYRHLTGAGCTTSSDGLFASFSLASRLSNSSDMVRSRTSRSRPLFSAPNSELFTGNYGCNRRSHLAHGTPQGGAGTGCEAVCCGRAGCEGEGRLRCDLAAPTVRCVIVVEPPGSKPLPTPPNVLPIWPKPDQRRRNAAASNRPHSDLSVCCHQSSTIMPMRVMC